MEKLAYLLKHRFPALFRIIETSARGMVAMTFGRRCYKAEEQATIDGIVRGRPASMQVLRSDDAVDLHEFLADLPPEYLEYFQPHPFKLEGLQKVLRSRAFLNYGLFVDDQLRGYALLKIAPTGSAFIGLLVHPEFGGIGLGKFIVDYLYWQASLAGLRTRSTISRSNPASLRAHQVVSESRVVAELPNDYIMIEFPDFLPPRPELCLRDRTNEE